MPVVARFESPGPPRPRALGGGLLFTRDDAGTVSVHNAPNHNRALWYARAGLIRAGFEWRLSTRSYEGTPTECQLLDAPWRAALLEALGIPDAPWDIRGADHAELSPIDAIWEGA